MTAAKILWGQVLAVAFIILASVWSATQWTAGALGFQPELGIPWFGLFGYPVYRPYDLFWWWFSYDAYAPHVFETGGMIATSGGFFAIVVAIAMSVWRGRETSNSKTYGSARWAERSDIERVGLLAETGVVLGQFNNQYLRHNGPEHVLCFAPTRSGKGVGLVIPTLLTWPGSAIVHDIKGENWELTAGFRSRFGRTLLFDPTNLASAHYNPLLEVRKGISEVRDVQNIADILVDPEGSLEKRNHWEKTSHALLVGAILHVLYAEPDKTLAGVAAFLSDPERDIDKTLDAMMDTPHLGEAGPHPVVASAARELKNKSDNERSGVLSTAMSCLGLYRDPVIAEVTKCSDWRIADLVENKRPATLYLVVPPSDISRTKPLIRLILNQIGRRLTEELHSKIQRHRVLMMLDEFPALGRLDFFESALAFMAGYGLKAFLIAQSLIQGRDFTVIVEGMNAVEAWLGSLPGHVYANVRTPPISTLNLAHMIPLSAVWAGPERDEHLAAPPLFYARTEGSTPFRFSLHVGDVGHTLIVGPTGAGKSVLLALMALQFRRYDRSQVFAFDFGGSIRAASLACGGDWQDLGTSLSEDSAGAMLLQPLARINEPAERNWAAEWLQAILSSEGVTVDPATKEHLWSALTSLSTAPVAERTLTGLAVLLQSQALKQALAPYCIGGPFGRLLDAEVEHLGEASFRAFETEGLTGSAAAPAVLSYLFHRIEGRLDGSPTMIIIDEGWLVLDSPEFAAQLREWLKTLRKKNASVVFATQSLADIETSAIAPAIIESCPTRIFLPNERAVEPQILSIYRRFGLNDRQIEIVARATPKRDYYCQSARGNRLFELGLGEVALAYTATSSKIDQLAIAELTEAHGTAGFAAAWLRHRGLSWAADMLPASDPVPPAKPGQPKE